MQYVREMRMCCI